jgi:hypothetical protein
MDSISIELGDLTNFEETKQYSISSFGSGIWNDVKMRYNFESYSTDWTDAAKNCSKVISTVFYTFFSVLCPAITFAVFMDAQTNGNISAIEVLLSSCGGSIFMSIFAGQPLTIVGVTGPISILTNILYQLSHSWGYNFLPFYAWCQIWAAIMHILLAITNTCSYVEYITTFSCEIFGLLIATIFLYSGLEGIYLFFHYEDDSIGAGLARSLCALDLSSHFSLNTVYKLKETNLLFLYNND